MYSRALNLRQSPYIEIYYKEREKQDNAQTSQILINFIKYY